MSKIKFSLPAAATAFVLLILTAVINPFNAITSQKDETRRQEVTTISSALIAYIEENAGSHPTYNNGAALPTVLNENILDKGVDASKIDRLDKYLNKLPKGPDGEEYKVGVNATGTVLVAAKLSDGTTFVK